MANISADGGLKLHGYRAAVITTFRRGSRIIDATTNFHFFPFFINHFHSRAAPTSLIFLPLIRGALSNVHTRVVADPIFPAYYPENSPRDPREKPHRNRIYFACGK